jgi:hypothetical protein
LKLLILAGGLALIAPCQTGLGLNVHLFSIQRIDPLVEHGNVPSAHLHQIVGGNVFAPVMNSSTMDISDKGWLHGVLLLRRPYQLLDRRIYFKARNEAYKLVAHLRQMTIYTTKQDFNSNGIKESLLSGLLVNQLLHLLMVD